MMFHLCEEKSTRQKTLYSCLRVSRTLLVCLALFSVSFFYFASKTHFFSLTFSVFHWRVSRWMVQFFIKIWFIRFSINRNRYYLCYQSRNVYIYIFCAKVAWQSIFIIICQYGTVDCQKFNNKKTHKLFGKFKYVKFQNTNCILCLKHNCADFILSESVRDNSRIASFFQMCIRRFCYLLKKGISAICTSNKKKKNRLGRRKREQKSEWKGKSLLKW